MKASSQDSICTAAVWRSRMRYTCSAASSYLPYCKHAGKVYYTHSTAQAGGAPHKIWLEVSEVRRNTAP